MTSRAVPLNSLPELTPKNRLRQRLHDVWHRVADFSEREKLTEYQRVTLCELPGLHGMLHHLTLVQTMPKNDLRAGARAL